VLHLYTSSVALAALTVVAAVTQNEDVEEITSRHVMQSTHNSLLATSTHHSTTQRMTNSTRVVRCFSSSNILSAQSPSFQSVFSTTHFLPMSCHAWSVCLWTGHMTAPRKHKRTNQDAVLMADSSGLQKPLLDEGTCGCHLANMIE